MENCSSGNNEMEEKLQSSDVSESESRIDGELVLRDLMDIICQYLNSKDLSCVAQVCQSWKEEASKEINKRHFEFKVWLGSCIKDPSFEVSTYLNNKPHFTLLFPSSGCAYKKMYPRDRRNSHYKPGELDLERETLNAYRKHFPNKLIVIGLTESTLDKNFISSLPLVRYEEDLEQRVVPHATLSLSLPVSKALNIKEGWVLESEYDRDDTSVFYSMIENLLDDNTEIKSAALLLFISNVNDHFWNRWADDQLVELFESISSRFPIKSYTIWGIGTPYKIYASDHRDTHDTDVPNDEVTPLKLFGLKLSGPNVETWSKIISTTIPKAKIFKELKSFRKRVNLKHFSMGFIALPVEETVPDWSEGHKYYRRIVNYIKKVFPEVPFLGIYGHEDTRCFSLISTGSDYKEFREEGQVCILILTY